METHNQQGAGTRGAGRKFAPAGTSRGNGTEAARERAQERMDAAIKAQPAEPWKPQDGEKFFCVCGDGEVCFVDFDEGFENDKEYIDFGNCFRTRKEAEAARERVRAALKGSTISEKETVGRSKGRAGNDEDEFTLGGKRYVAKTFNPCKGCVFSSFPGTCSQYARPECDSERRKDGRDVVFVLKETEAER